MEHVEEISCIKDGKTGICRDIKDKTARTSIADLTLKINEIIETVNGLSGGSSVDLTALQEQITALENTVNTLDSIYATDTDIQAINTDIQTINTEIQSIRETLAGLEGGSSDVDLTPIQEQLTSISDRVTALENNDPPDLKITTCKESALTFDENGIASLNTGMSTENYSYDTKTKVTTPSLIKSVVFNKFIEGYNTLVNNVKTVTEQVTELEQNKANADLSNVVDSYISSDGLTWYRKYSDGWKECGGFVTGFSSFIKTVTLPIEFSNANYNISLTPEATTGGEDTYSWWVYNTGTYVKTVNSFSIRNRANTPYMYYECRGY